ncbi:hypothetical protein MY1884_003465 [Beauveria asiatica]
MPRFHVGHPIRQCLYDALSPSHAKQWTEAEFHAEKDKYRARPGPDKSASSEVIITNVLLRFPCPELPAQIHEPPGFYKWGSAAQPTNEAPPLRHEEHRAHYSYRPRPGLALLDVEGDQAEKLGYCFLSTGRATISPDNGCTP